MDLNFANPLGFLALLGLPAVLAIHFLQRQTRHLVISTYFLVEELDRQSEQGRRWERLRTSLLLWLQLLAVLLLTWLLAQPTWLRPESVQQTALVLDSSVSLQPFAEELRRAVRREVHRLAAAAARSEWTVLESDPTRETLYRGPDAAALLDALAGWTPRSGHHDPRPALQTARTLIGPRGTVVFVTDRAPASPLPGVEQLAVGRPLDNVGFVGAAVERGADGVRWRALLVNHTDRPQRRRYHLEAGPLRAPPQEAALEPGGITSLRGEWPADQPRARLVLEADDFPLDDALPLVIPARKPLRLALEGPEPAHALLQRLADSFDAVAVGPAAGADLRLAAASGAAPPEGAPGIYFRWSDAPGGPVRRGPVVADRHPLMDGLNWQGLLVAGESGFAVTNTDTVLLWQQDQPLIFLRERGPVRQLVLNFALNHANADRLPAFVLLARRFVEEQRADKVAPERLNVDLDQSLRVAANPKGGAATLLRASGAPVTLRPGPDGRLDLQAPAEPGWFSVEQDGRALLEAAAGFADTREADFRAASATNTLAARAAEIGELNRRSDLLAPVWLLLLGAVLVGSWYRAGRA